MIIRFCLLIQPLFGDCGLKVTGNAELQLVLKSWQRFILGRNRGSIRGVGLRPMRVMPHNSSEKSAIFLLCHPSNLQWPGRPDQASPARGAGFRPKEGLSMKEKQSNSHPDPAQAPSGPPFDRLPSPGSGSREIRSADLPLLARASCACHFVISSPSPTSVARLQQGDGIG